MTEVHGRGGLGPRYRVIDGVQVQVYERRDHGFRWHFDGHPYVALATLENSNEGQTQFISPGLSRWLRFLLYPLYALPQIFSIFPRSTVTAKPGDLLVMRGGRVLHRGVTLLEEGERILLAYTYAEPGHQPNPFRDFVARRLNY
jgi:hypothetical protein